MAGEDSRDEGGLAGVRYAPSRWVARVGTVAKP